MAEHNKGSDMTPVKQILQDNKTEKEGGFLLGFNSSSERLNPST